MAVTNNYVSQLANQAKTSVDLLTDAGLTATQFQSITAGTAAASKAVVLDANSKIDALDITTLKIGGTSITPTAAQINLLVQGVAAGYKVARGTSIITGSLLVTHGLATVVAWAANTVGLTGTKVNNCIAITADMPSGTPTKIRFKRWKHTAPSTNTLIQATAAGTISWICVGT